MQTIAWALFATFTLIASAAPFPPPTDLGPVNSYGKSLRWSVEQMAGSTSSNQNTVRVLFYGQSITAQAWSYEVARHLREQFPRANLVISNLAIPGFTSDVLVKTAESDLYPFYPDLLIFQAYGSTGNYRQIIQRVRARTTADILIQSNHPLLPEDLDEPTDPAEIHFSKPEAFYNYIFLPDLVKYFGCELADVRTYWKAYLREHNLEPSALLSDTIHLNDHGNYVMAELVKPYLRPPAEDDLTPLEPAVLTIPIQASSTEVFGMNFVGNRLDLIGTDSAAGHEPVEVLIDGRPPSEFPELYTFTRTTAYRFTSWPVITRMTSMTPLVEEDWVLTVNEFDEKLREIRFSLTGSRTGFDGEGRSSATFVSNSGRVIIKPQDWWIGDYAAGPLPRGFEVKWSVRYTGSDYWMPQPGPKTVAQGLANGPHRLTLRGSGLKHLAGIRIYNPLARKQPARARAASLKIKRAANKFELEVKAQDRQVLEVASGPSGPWRAMSAPIEEGEFVVEAGDQVRFFRARAID